MVKNKRVITNIGLIVALIIVPLLIMTLMGFDKYDADEFRIISVAVLADIVVYIAYKLLLHRLSS